MEYGRECWTSAYLSALSVELKPSRCDFACEGNASEICGGSLTLSLFNLTGDSIGGSSKSGAMKAGTDGWSGLMAAAVGVAGLGAAVLG